MPEEDTAPRIIQIMPADGWSVHWRDGDVEPLIGWALVEFDTGYRYVTGLYSFCGDTEIAGWADGRRDGGFFTYRRDSE